MEGLGAAGDVRSHGLEGGWDVLGHTRSSHQQHSAHAAAGTSSLGIRRDALCPWGAGGAQDSASPATPGSF